MKQVALKFFDEPVSAFFPRVRDENEILRCAIPQKPCRVCVSASVTATVTVCLAC